MKMSSLNKDMLKEIKQKQTANNFRKFLFLENRGALNKLNVNYAHIKPHLSMFKS
jgi:hypothetical protein